MVSDLLDEDSNFLVHQIGPLVLYRVSAAFGDNSAAVGGEAFETFLLCSQNTLCSSASFAVPSGTPA
jgi:hypothetical protein